jgi:hypothetical protein
MARRSRRIHHHHRQRKDRCSLCLIKTGSDSAGFETKSICKVLETDTSFGSEEVVVSPGSKRRDTERHTESSVHVFFLCEVMTENPEFCDDLRILWCSW